MGQYPVQPKCVEVRELGQVLALGAGLRDRKLYQKLHSPYLKRPPPVVFRGLIQRNSGGESVKLDWALNGGACDPSKIGVKFASE